MASPGGLNWNCKLAGETWEPSCLGVFYAERSDDFDSYKILGSLRIRTILNYLAVVPICLVCLMWIVQEVNLYG